MASIVAVIIVAAKMNYITNSNVTIVVAVVAVVAMEMAYSTTVNY